MIGEHKVVVIMPAYNAARTLEKTYKEIPLDIVDEVVLVDDDSDDNTVCVARRIGITHIVSLESNRGYGGNQKTCYRYALELDADIVVMLHPDYQYTPRLIKAMCSLIDSGLYPVVLGSRILGKGANRLLTAFQNFLIGQKLSEYHTGLRAYSGAVLNNINFEANSDDFIFDNQIISQIFMAGYEIAEITCPTRYFKEASSINFRRSVYYGLGVLLVSLMHWMSRRNIIEFEIYRVKSS